ncbi:MAG: zinc-ribbon domain-containing protein [Desulfobacterales bacterium]|jgi:predicted Zn finger-like uncharacterized protein
MKVQCPYCNTQYQLDDKKIPNKKIKFKCRKCQKPVYVNKGRPASTKHLSQGQMVCPKCGQRQAAADECIQCGIVIEKYEAYLAKKKQVESEASEGMDKNVSSMPHAQTAEEEIDKQENSTPGRITCKACTQEISAGVNFCPHCGQPAKIEDST